ncbi:MAG TPA: carboxylating nicotinate-nucleotide diphosphorylase [Candidatus Thermoplasmatota archaeon]|nr:carboxylating nicotinate-nucleotide diphosphorylase [Candidatus Thermoplasmatota archaeon]
MDLDLLAFLAEDVGAGDVTTRAIGGDARVRADLVAREACVVCGLDEAAAVFAHLGAKVERLRADGDEVAEGEVAMRVDGPASAVLTGERLALNLVMRMSGIATATRRVQASVAARNPACRVAATRKTTPGFRRFEKRAVVVGGGDPHRAGLWDAFLVKDNHLLIEPDARRAVARCRALDPAKPLQVEADTAQQALAAAEAGADAVLLDNFTPEAARVVYRELKARFPRLLVEVSGGVTEETAPLYADAADRISMGSLTHSARSVDFGLDVRT